MDNKELLYGFTVKDFIVNDINYSMVFTPSLYRDLDGLAETLSIHVILVNSETRSIGFHFGGTPAINIDEQLLPAGVVVEIIKIYQEFWKAQEPSLDFYKLLTDELLEYLTGKGVTHFKIDELLNDSIDQLNPAIDEFLFEAHSAKEGDILPDEYIPINSERFNGMLNADRTRFFVSINAADYLAFYEQYEKKIVVS